MPFTPKGTQSGFISSPNPGLPLALAGQPHMLPCLKSPSDGMQRAESPEPNYFPKEWLQHHNLLEVLINRDWRERSETERKA